MLSGNDATLALTDCSQYVRRPSVLLPHMGCPPFMPIHAFSGGSCLHVHGLLRLHVMEDQNIMQ